MRADLSREGKFQWLARLGFAVRGLLYVLIALLVIVAGRTEGLTGAMLYVRSGFGRWLLIVIAAGMIGYGLWRLSDALFGMDSGRHSSRSWGRRIAAGFSGAIYLTLSWKALEMALYRPGGDEGARQTAASALRYAGGDLVIWAAAAMLAGAAVVQVLKAASCSFLDQLDESARRPWVKWMGRIGYAARGAVFGTLAILLVGAAVDRSSSEAGGLEQALDALWSPARYAVAFGLLLFGAFSMLQARYRGIHTPPVDHLKRKVRETIST